MEKQIYVNAISTLWGGNNGEINMETDDGTTITFCAYELFRDMPHIVNICREEIELEMDMINKSIENSSK